ncbi:MAG: CdaR family protein [Hyphomicrobiales bacterium]
MICLVISFVFWFLIKLSNDYSITLTLPVKYTDIPENQYLSQKIDSTIDVRLRGQGFVLFSEKFFHKQRPIIIPLDRILIHNHKYSFSKYILIRDLPKIIYEDKDLSPDNTTILTDTLSFVLETSNSKKVPIIPNINVSYRKQYDLYDSIILSPDSITLKGPHSILNEINSIQTEKINLHGLDRSKEITASLIIPNQRQVEASTYNIDIDIPVEKFTEESLDIPITSLGQLKIKFFPSTAKVTFKVAIKDYKKVKPNQFKIIAIEDDNNTNKATLSLKKYPSYIKIQKTEPKEVEYLIIK